MTKVMAHTSKVGYYVREQTHQQTRTVRSSGSKSYFNWPAQVGISYKSGTRRSDGRKPTDYSRCIIRAIGNAYDYYDPLVRTEGSNSFWSNGLQMNSRPWGQLSLGSGNVHPSSYLVANAISRSKNKLNGNAAHILEDLAQARQTASMAVDLVKDIGKATGKYLAVYSAILQGGGILAGQGGPKTMLKRRRGHNAPVRRLAKAWLTWYYGIKPLISSINQLGKAWEPKYDTVRSSTKERAELSPSSLFNNGLYGRKRITVTGTAYEEATCVLICDVKLTSNLNALANLGFHGGDPLSDSTRDDYGGLINDTDVLTLGWALLPYSFVFDWIVPVENFLKTLYWSPNILYKGGYVTKYMYGRANGVIQNNTSFDGGYGGKMPSGIVEALLFEREAYSDYPPPSILAVNQSISNPSTLASAIALAVLKL